MEASAGPQYHLTLSSYLVFIFVLLLVSNVNVEA